MMKQNIKSKQRKGFFLLLPILVSVFVLLPSGCGIPNAANTAKAAEKFLGEWQDESGNVHKFVPDNYIAFVPEGPLGSTWYGVSPEEADLMSGASDAQVSIVNTGVAITQIIDPHPVNVNTFASEIVLPSFERMNECALMKVAED